MKIEFVVKDTPTLHDPVVICGLPGSAFVGKFAVDHLIGELPAKALAEVYSPGFPPQVLIKDDGTTTLMRNDLYYWKNTQHGKRDLIFYTGDAQPQTSESEYELSEAVVDFLVREYHVSELITLGAYVTGAFSRAPQVYAAATDSSFAKEMTRLGCKLMGEGAITGMNGILLGIAKLKGMKGFTLLGETSGYVFDPKASESVILLLTKIIGVTVDLAKLEARAKEAQEVIQAIEKMRREPRTQPPVSDESKRLGYIS